MELRFSAKVFACAPATARDPSASVGMTDTEAALVTAISTIWPGGQRNSPGQLHFQFFEQRFSSLQITAVERYLKCVVNFGQHRARLTLTACARQMAGKAC